MINHNGYDMPRLGMNGFFCCRAAEGHVEVSIAFQGGGARVVELMAAANACSELEKDNREFRVLRVTGASAGAVAASMFATGCAIDAIAGQGEALKRLIERHFSAGQLATWRIGWRLARGRSVYDEDELRQALVALFALGGIDATRPLRELVLEGRELRIMQSDISTDQSLSVDERDSTALADALVDSCAIPFAFRVPQAAKHRAHILDGGLFQNLPARAAMADLPPDCVPLGISFEEEPGRETRWAGLASYAGGILGSLLAERVRDSGAVLKPSNVIRIAYNRGTFEFGKIFEGNFYTNFTASVRDARLRVESWMAGLHRLGGADWSSDHPQDVLAQVRESADDLASFVKTMGEFKYQATLLHHEVIFQSGASTGLLPDIYQLHIHLDGAKNAGFQFLQFWVYDLKGGPLKRTRVSVTGKEGAAVNALVLPIRYTEFSGVRSGLLCLEKPLQAGDFIRITKTEESFSGMLDYMQKGFNFEGLNVRPGKSADEIRITVHFPPSEQPINVRDTSTDGHEAERQELSRLRGNQLLTSTSRMKTLRAGSVSFVSVVRGVAPSSEPQFVNVVYDRGRR